jgi:hypothetical protein
MVQLQVVPVKKMNIKKIKKKKEKRNKGISKGAVWFI